MKKRFFNISMMFVLVLCTIFCISSCSKDDDKKGDEEQYSIIGKWKCAFSPTDYDIVIFEENSTGVLEYYYKGNLDQRESFTYSYSGAVIKMHFGNETETLTIAWLDKNRFTDVDYPDDIYVRLTKDEKDYYGNEKIINVESVSLSQSNIELVEGNTETLTATVKPYNATNKHIIWSSSNSTVASVENGKVIAHKAGSADITVMTKDGGKTATCSVTVKTTGPQLIDLGLSVKWASCNVGASKPEDYGGYYAWGETSEKSYYDSDTYQYYTNRAYQHIGDDISGTQYDVARVLWGGNWRMPTREEFEELKNNCTSEWTVYGRRFTSKKNGNSIFLPAAGYKYLTERCNAGFYGGYWTSSLYTGNKYSACSFIFIADVGAASNSYRNLCHGLPVRPVSE